MPPPKYEGVCDFSHFEAPIEVLEVYNCAGICVQRQEASFIVSVLMTVLSEAGATLRAEIQLMVVRARAWLSAVTKEQKYHPAGMGRV